MTRPITLLLGSDDVSFCDNQSEIENEVVLAMTNVLAVSTSLRVSGNRLQKRATAGILSAITFGLLNQTSANQTTHCILAIGPAAGRTVAGNRDVFGLFGFGLCETLNEIATALGAGLTKRYALNNKPAGG